MRLIALLIIIVIALCAVLIPKQPNAGLPVVKAAVPICIPPMSHYQWKQWRIA